MENEEPKSQTPSWFANLKNSLWAAVIAFLGILVSVFSSSALNFSKTQPVTFYIGYAGACAGLFLLIWGREKVVAHEAESTKNEYQKKQEALISILQNFPPVHSLENFSLSYKEVIKLKRLYDEKDEPLEPEEWQKNVRRCLSALVILFKQFNHTADSANYSINIMFYVEKDTFDFFMSQDEQKEILRNLRFVEDPSNPWNKLEAVLSLDPSLSCCSKNIDDSPPDPDLKPIALPVVDHQLEPKNHRSRYIPVAPMAIKHDVVYVKNTSIFAKEETYEDYEIYPELKDRLKTYFKSEGSKRVGSILSIRMDYPSSYEEDSILGVLNIHSDRPNDDMKDESTISAYLMMARPMIEHLKDLLIGTTIVYDLEEDSSESESLS